MALNLLYRQLLNKTLGLTKGQMKFAPVIIHQRRTQSQSVDASTIVNRSPYEEINARLDANSSRDNPMKINAYGEERTIACVCDDMHFMTLKKGPPVKCKCGYWFQLVDANKFWEKDTDSS